MSIDALDDFDAFPQVLAHERGHNTCLDHVAPGNQCLLMQAVSGGGCLSSQECGKFAAAAGGQSGTCGCYSSASSYAADGGSALLHRPKAFLLDEPLTGLDPRAIRTLYAVIREAAADGAAVLLSTHLLSQIENLCSHFLILARGRSLALGSKEDIRVQLPSLGRDASLEEIFFQATEGAESASGESLDGPGRGAS